MNLPPTPEEATAFLAEIGRSCKIDVVAEFKDRPYYNLVAGYDSEGKRKLYVFSHYTEDAGCDIREGDPTSVREVNEIWHDPRILGRWQCGPEPTLGGS